MVAPRHAQPILYVSSELWLAVTVWWLDATAVNAVWTDAPVAAPDTEPDAGITRLGVSSAGQPGLPGECVADVAGLVTHLTKDGGADDYATLEMFRSSFGDSFNMQDVEQQHMLSTINDDQVCTAVCAHAIADGMRRAMQDPRADPKAKLVVSKEPEASR